VPFLLSLNPFPSITIHNTHFKYERYILCSRGRLATVPVCMQHHTSLPKAPSSPRDQLPIATVDYSQAMKHKNIHRKASYELFYVSSHSREFRSSYTERKTIIILIYDVHMSVHRKYISKVQPKRCKVFLYLFISINCSTCFRLFHRPSSGTKNCTYSVRYCQTNTAWAIILLYL